MSDTKKSTRRKTASKPSTPAPLTTAASPTKAARRANSTAKSSAAPKAAAPRRAAKPKTAEVQRSAPQLDIVMITPEAHPFAKTGGLAEVAAALPDALARLGHAVTIVMPRYRSIAVGDTHRKDLSVTFGSTEHPFGIYERPLRENVRAAFVDIPALFDREGLYGTAS